MANNRKKSKNHLKLIKYSNAVSARFLNRRITLIDTDNNFIGVRLDSVDKRRLEHDITPQSMVHVSINKKVHSSLEFGLTDESAEALYLLLGAYLNDRRHESIPEWQANMIPSKREYIEINEEE